MTSATLVLPYFLIFTILLVITAAAPQFLPQRTLPTYSNEPPTPYQYQYKVENAPTNTFFGKNEVGDAAGRVTGSYYVYLPDGRLMTIDYSVDGDSGFQPRISFSNQGGGAIRG